MIHIKKPDFTQEEVLISCTNNLRNKIEKNLLLESLYSLNEFSLNYDILAKKGNLNLYNEELKNTEIGSLLKKMYNNKLSKKGQMARCYYDSLMNYDVSGICPYCKTAKANNLDHYLPKSEYPSLAINPLNLLPICFKCNDDKGTSTKPLIHLYYDNIQNINWLKCKLHKSKPLKLEFYVDETEFDDEALFKKVNNTFHKYNISSTYETLSINELIDRFHSFKTIFKECGYIELKEELKLETKHMNNKNTWRYSLYNEISGSNDWYYKHLMEFNIEEVFT